MPKTAATKAARGTAKRGRPREFDQTAALDRAMDLFWRQGYEATSIQALTAAMGLTPPQLYAAFGSKDQLYEAAVQRYAETAGAFAVDALSERDTARESIEHLLLGAAEIFTRPGLPRGCMVVLAASNCSSPEISDGMRIRRGLSEDAIANRIQRGIQAGELPAHNSAPQLGKFYAGIFQAMSIQARDGATREELEAMARLAMKVWPG